LCGAVLGGGHSFNPAGTVQPIGHRPAVGVDNTVEDTCRVIGILGHVGHLFDCFFLCDEVAQGIIRIEVGAARVGHAGQAALEIYPLIIGVGDILGGIRVMDRCQAI